MEIVHRKDNTWVLKREELGEKYLHKMTAIVDKFNAAQQEMTKLSMNADADGFILDPVKGTVTKKQ